MVLLVVGICVGALSLVGLAILALNLWSRVGRLAREVRRAQQRTGVVVAELQLRTAALEERRGQLARRSGGSSSTG